jgi:hypothetical protein
VVAGLGSNKVGRQREGAEPRHRLLGGRVADPRGDPAKGVTRDHAARHAVCCSCRSFSRQNWSSPGASIVTATWNPPGNPYTSLEAARPCSCYEFVKPVTAKLAPSLVILVIKFNVASPGGDCSARCVDGIVGPDGDGFVVLAREFA